MIQYGIILILILVALALPAADQRNSWPWFFVALVLSFFGVILPLFVFFFSSFLIFNLDWKGACRHGWVDCFILGKLALTPFVLAATAALYRVDILRSGEERKRWIIVAILLGALIAAVCFIFGVTYMHWQLWLLVPLYVAIWYAIRAGQLMAPAGFGPGTYLRGLLGTLPFWIASGWWSHHIFTSLPDKVPARCFIVTAASRGHTSCVGPLIKTSHNGRVVYATRQLLTFWQLENIWHAWAPLSHAIFRKAYNRLGPILASCIQSPWLADAVFYALKPAEWLARLCLSLSRNHSFEEWAERQLRPTNNGRAALPQSPLQRVRSPNRPIWPTMPNARQIKIVTSSGLN